ncbi:hypothetical protein SBD_6886 [Streptomyces bottropensis ATCC 25435]|uniref:Transposase n=1 Tax=Streptomyces bottropensis ATCC 25435 TaxID=1054862 RepID=M3FJV7_9ACTN|nr:hypothetical protein SBD_6886 [Streptomyces bottropensis ATCC 25435]
MDTKGLPLFVMVTPADMTDRNAAKEVLFRLRLMHPGIIIVWAGSAYAGQLATWAKTYLNLTIKTVSRLDHACMEARTRLRTAHPTLRVAHHLGSDHPHEQANHPPKLPQRRPASIPGSPAGLIVSKAGAITLAQTRPRAPLSHRRRSLSADPTLNGFAALRGGLPRRCMSWWRR